MNRIYRAVLLSVCMLALTACGGISTLKAPIDKPYLSTVADGDNWQANIVMPGTGTLDYKFMNTGHVKGSLWLAYRIGFYENGVLMQESTDFRLFSREPMRQVLNDDINIKVRYVPQVSGRGLAKMEWKIILAPHRPDWNNHPDDAVTVKQGTEISFFGYY